MRDISAHAIDGTGLKVRARRLTIVALLLATSLILALVGILVMISTAAQVSTPALRVRVETVVSKISRR